MASTIKFLTKNGLKTQNIDFSSPTEVNTIQVRMLDGGVLSFSGTSGQLFSISDSLTGTIFSVNDISGIPSIEVDDTGVIRFAQYSGNTLFGTAVDNGVDKVQVNGTVSAISYSSTVATGTAPFTVSSTTKVTNLYADRAALADNSTLVGGYAPNASVSNNTLVLRNASGYVFGNYFNMTANVSATSASHIAIQNSSDNFLRWQTPAQFIANHGLAALLSPALTGTPTAPTAAVNTNTTQLATTAFVNAEIANDAAPFAHVGSGGTAHANVVAAGAAGFMTGADKTKLDGIAAGAQVNTVTSVATRTGAVVLTKSDVGLANVDNTTDLLKPISTATQTALDGKAPLTGAGTSGTWPISVTGQSGSFAVIDDRNVVSQPDQVPDRSGVFNFRFKENVGNPPFPAHVSYAHVLTVNGWAADGTGGWPTQMSFGERLSYRKGATSTTWGNWKQLVDSSSIGEFAPSLTGTGATGNWGISVTGNAATATKLATARTINGIAFDGSANISVPVDWSAVTGIPDVIAAGADKASARAAIDAASLVGGKIPEHELPALAITDVFPVASEAAMLALTAEQGDMAIRSDLNKCFALSAAPASTLANWLELKTPADAVLSVAGRTGAVTLTKTDVGLGNVDNTSDAAKSVASAATLTTARTINGVSFNGSANITVADSTKLPTAGGTMSGTITFAAGQTWPTFNQSTTGNAATATKLATARTINGVPFDGTANVTVTAQPVFVQQHSDNTSNGTPFVAGVEYSLRVNGTYSRSTPVSPAIGDKFILNNLYNTWDSGLFTLTRGSPTHKINNIQQDVVFDANARRVELTYIYANEWIMAIS